MSKKVLVGNGVVMTGGSKPRVIPNGALVWQGDRILAVGEEAKVRREHPDTLFLDACGGTILPGIVNLHHHFYSALARGLDPETSMTNFPEVLDRLWWRLDRALDLETVRVSALLSVAECVRHGCTTVFDHHASPSCVAGSLDAIAEAVETAGISAALCYEVTDRNGTAGAAAGIDENLRFLRERADDPRIRGVFGLHASFTLSDDTLHKVAEGRPASSGCHVHLAEDPIDIEASVEAFGTRPLERLEHFGLLGERSLLAHGIHLEAEEYEEIARVGAILVHNPESNANNGVGRLDVDEAARVGCLVGLGTDGMSSSVLRALRFAFLTHRGARHDPSAGFESLPQLLYNNVTAARRFFPEPRLGKLVADAPADLIVVDSETLTPISWRNQYAHLVYGVSEAPVRHTVARGRILLEHFHHTKLDVQELAARARELSPRLWERFHSLDWGTNFLGAGE